MKIFWIMMMLAGVLAGCSAKQTFETVTDVYNPQSLVNPKQVEIIFGEELECPVIENDNGKLYLFNGYEVAVETLPGGNLQATLLSLTGYPKEKLTVLETGYGDMMRYECVWTAAGESGDVVARAAILDDGNYHYCMTMIADADVAGSLQICWADLIQSFSLA